MMPEGSVIVRGLAAASSLKLDTEGRLYIADPGRHVVDIRQPDGRQAYVLGGPGTRESEFDEPADVDPTNGLLIAVADAGNGRIQRFTSRFQLVESIPLYRSTPTAPGSGAGAGDVDESRDGRIPGRPVAVAVSESNETFAIDQVRGVVAKWDIGRQFVTFIGDESDYGRLDRPVDIEIMGDRLFVADAGLKSIVVFDLFGGFVTEFGSGRLSQISGIGSWGRMLWVLHGRELTVYSANGRMEARHTLPDSISAAVDVAVFERSLYVVAQNRVITWPLDPSGRIGLAVE